MELTKTRNVLLYKYIVLPKLYKYIVLPKAIFPAMLVPIVFFFYTFGIRTTVPIGTDGNVRLKASFNKNLRSKAAHVISLWYGVNIEALNKMRNKMIMKCIKK